MEEQFKPFDKVLVRNEDFEEWFCTFFSHLTTSKIFLYNTGGFTWKQCIPFEGNEHLVGTTDAPGYKRNDETQWLPQDGDFVVIGSDKTATLIFKEINSFGLVAYAGWNSESNSLFQKEKLSGFIERPIRPAMDEEKEFLLYKLHENGEDWNPVMKRIEEYRWYPNLREKYWTVTWFDNEFFRQFWEWTGSSVDLDRKKRGWIFKKESEAVDLVRRLNEAIENIK